MDDAMPLTPEIAVRKAYTAAIMRQTTDAFAAKCQSRKGYYESIRDAGARPLWAGGAGGIPICSGNVRHLAKHDCAPALPAPLLRCHLSEKAVPSQLACAQPRLCTCPPSAAPPCPPRPSCPQQLIGAVGASGGDPAEDLECLEVGLQAAGLRRGNLGSSLCFLL